MVRLSQICITILATYQDTHFCLSVYGYEIDLIVIGVSATFNVWTKICNGEEEIDIARYAKLILDLVEGIEIYNFYIEYD